MVCSGASPSITATHEAATSSDEHYFPCARVIPSRKIVLSYAFAWIVIYVILCSFFKDYLPDKYFRDFVQIQKLTEANERVEDWGGAFQMAAMMVRILPMWLINAIVMTIGSCNYLDRLLHR